MKKEASRLKSSGSPHINWIELTACGRHAFRVRESHAGNPPPLYLPVQGLRPCSQLIHALYGRSFGPSKSCLGTSAQKACGPWSGYGIHGGGFSSSSRNEFLRGRFGAHDLNSCSLFAGGRESAEWVNNRVVWLARKSKQLESAPSLADN